MHSSYGENYSWKGAICFGYEIPQNPLAPSKCSASNLFLVYLKTIRDAAEQEKLVFEAMVYVLNHTEAGASCWPWQSS